MFGVSNLVVICGFIQFCNMQTNTATCQIVEWHGKQNEKAGTGIDFDEMLPAEDLCVYQPRAALTKTEADRVRRKQLLVIYSTYLHIVPKQKHSDVQFSFLIQFKKVPGRENITEPKLHYP